MLSTKYLYPNLSDEQYTLLCVDAVTPTLADGIRAKILTSLHIKGSGAKDSMLIRDIEETRTNINTVYNLYNDNGTFKDTKKWHELCDILFNDTNIIITIEHATKSPQVHELLSILFTIFNNEYIDTGASLHSSFGVAIRVILFNTPYSQKWISTRHETVRNTLIIDILDRTFNNTQFPPSLHNISHLDEIVAITPDHPYIAYYYLFTGQWDKATDLQQRFANDEDHITSNLIQGVLDFLQGRFTEAVNSLTLAQKYIRSTARKPTFLLHSVFSTALQLSRIALGDAKSLKSMRNDCKKITSRDYESQIDMRGILALDARLCGKEEEAHNILYYSNLYYADNILSNLLYYTLTKQIPYTESITDTYSTNISNKLEYIESSYRFFKDICKMFPVIECLFHDIESPNDSQNIRDKNAIHCIKLTSLIQNTPLWEAKLNALAQLAEKTTSSQINTSRLAWLINAEYHSIQPIEQKKQKNGSWSNGRNISVKRLLEEGDSIPWATEQDKRVFVAIKRDESWYSTSFSFSFRRSLAFLVEHPFLFDEKTRTPLYLKQKEIKLILTQNTQDCNLTTSPIPSDGELQYGFMCTKQDDTLTFTHIPTAHRSFLQMLGQGLRFPADALPRVMEVASQSGLPLSMDIKTETVPADPTPIIQIQQQDTIFTGSIKVRPCTALGTPLYTPTLGPAYVVTAVPIADQKGKAQKTRPIATTRDFQAEQRAIDQLFAACPSLEEKSSSLDNAVWQLTFYLPFQLLQVLQELQALQEAQPDSTPFIIEWPTGEQIKLYNKVQPFDVQVSLKQKGDWFALDGQIRVSEHIVLGLSNLLDAMKGSQKNFIPLGNGEFLALSQDLQKKLEQLEHLAQKSSGKRSTKKDELLIHPLAAEPLEKTVVSLDFAADTHWKKTVSRMEAAFTMTPELPRTLQATLRPYQIEGFEWLCRLAHWGVGACLADDMGLGKTVQTIAAMLTLAHDGPCLVVAPTSVCSNWESELARFAPSLNVHRLGAASTRKKLIERLQAHDVLIVGYGLLHNEIKHLSLQSWSMTIFDEAQALKNATTKRAKAGHSIEAKFKLALTGTPVENRLDDVWSLFNTINAGLLGSADAFRQRFGSSDKAATKTLRALVRPFILRRLKSHVLDELPMRTEQTIIIEPSAHEEAFYEALRRRAVASFEATEENAGQRRMHIFGELTKLRRACCHPSLADKSAASVLHTGINQGSNQDIINKDSVSQGSIAPNNVTEAGAASSMAAPSSKLSRFLEMVQDLCATGHKMLVFSQFVDHLHMARQALTEKNISFQYLDGSTPEKDRAKRVTAFQSGQGDVFLISLRAGGQGLNLTAADYVFHLDPWWNPAVEDQASDRAHRMGQLRPVTIYRLVMARTVEEKILALHQQKRDLAADFLANTDSGAMPLSEAELMELFVG
ncbi:MAG: DEAD/DEAH box helicase [Pseudomonadota bacterium]